MTVPSYTEDLTDIATGDESTGWVELTGTDGGGEVYNAQGAPADSDNEYPYIQGSYAITQDCTKSTAVGSLAYSSGGVTIPTDGAFFVWHNFSSPFVMGTYAQGGYRLCVGSGLGDFKVWYVGGSDKDNNPYGGFVNHVVNPTVTEDDSAGTPTATLDYVGSAVYVLSGPSKGEPHQCDVMRYGRGSAIFEYGETANYCNMSGFAAANDAQAARWGLIQASPGGYLWKGRMQLGTATNAVDFRDSNKVIFIQWTPKVTTNFNTIEVLNASSNIEMTGFQFICLDPTGTASKGRWITTNNATVSLDSCTFYDMYTFVFDSNATILSCGFKRCGQVTQGGADMDFCTFDNSDAAVSLVASSINAVSDCTFISDGSNHAVNLGTISTTQAITWGNYLSGYASSDGSTGNEAILVSVDTDKTLTINVTSGYDTPSVYNTGAGSVSVVNAVTVNVYVKDSANAVVEGASVGVYKSSDDTQIINETTAAGTGLATESFAYVSSTDVYIRVRKSSTGTRYIPVLTTGTITSDGLTLTVVLNEDNIAT